MTAAAFFDVDRTLVAGSSGYAFARAAVRSGLIPRRTLLRVTREALRFRLQGSTDQQTERAREQIAELIRDVEVRELRRLTPDILADLLPRVFPEMLRIAYEHQDAGRQVIIVTAAGQEIADLLRFVLDFDGAIGFRSEVVDGRYTGRAAGPFTYREGKAVAMRELAGRDGLDLEASYAYSDSESDLPMLRAVGHPVAVNPDRELAAIARAEGWEVLRFDRLHARMRIAGTVVLAAAVGTLAARVGPRRVWRQPPARRPRTLTVRR